MGTKKTSVQFSPRSQESILKELKLRDQIAQLRNVEGGSQRRLDDFLQSRERVAKRFAEDSGMLDLFNVWNSKVQAEEISLKGIREQIAALEAEISQLQNTPKEAAAERLRNQRELADKAHARLSLDAEIKELFESLRVKLEERSKLTDAMEATARNIDIARLEGDPWEHEELRRQLMKYRLRESSEWTLRFLGERTNTRAYVIQVSHLTLPETLIHCGVYAFGDAVMLSDEEVHEHTREDRPGRRDSAPWALLPADVATPEDFEQLQKSAAEHGSNVQETKLWDELERLGKIRVGPKGVRPSQPYTGRTDFREEAVNIRVKAVRTIDCDGTVYKPGEVFTLHKLSQFWELADIGHIERP